MAIEFAGFVYNSLGVAVNGATVNLYDRNTTTPSRANTTTNTNGFWSISHGTQGRFDIEITNGAAKRRIKYDDIIQMEEVEVALLAMRNPANTFKYDITPAAIVADRVLNLPLITGADTLMVLGLAQTVTGAITLSAAASIIMTGALDLVAQALVGNGGSTGITISANGEVNMVAQPMFLVLNSTVRLNVTGNTAQPTVIFDTEIYDQNGDFASNTFTAPVAGRYLLTPSVRLLGITSAADDFFMNVVTSNRTYSAAFRVAANAMPQSEAWLASVIADMDASDTATVTIGVTGEASEVVDIRGGAAPDTFFSGKLEG